MEGGRGTLLILVSGEALKLSTAKLRTISCNTSTQPQCVRCSRAYTNPLLTLTSFCFVDIILDLYYSLIPFSERTQHQESCVEGPGEFASDLHPQELGATDDLHRSVVDEEWCMTGPRFPEVNNDLLCLVNIEDQVVDFTPVHQVFHLVPEGQFVVVLDEAQLCRPQTSESGWCC